MQQPVQQPSTAPAAADGWKCSCGAVNKGKFCPECGACEDCAGMICVECESYCEYCVEAPGAMKYNEQQHWNSCTKPNCNGRLNPEAHDDSDGIITKQPKPDEEGIMSYICIVCGQIKEEALTWEDMPQPTSTPETPKENVTDVFSDVYDDWYTEYVQYVYDHDLMTGIKGTDRFEPNANITKAQVAAILQRFCENVK